MEKSKWCEAANHHQILMMMIGRTLCQTRTSDFRLQHPDSGFQMSDVQTADSRLVSQAARLTSALSNSRFKATKMQIPDCGLRILQSKLHNLDSGFQTAELDTPDCRLVSLAGKLILALLNSRVRTLDSKIRIVDLRVRNPDCGFQTQESKCWIADGWLPESRLRLGESSCQTYACTF